MILIVNKLALKDETKRDREESRARKNEKCQKFKEVKQEKRTNFGHNKKTRPEVSAIDYDN